MGFAKNIENFAQGLPGVGPLFGNNALDEQRKDFEDAKRAYLDRLKAVEAGSTRAIQYDLSMFGPLLQAMQSMWGPLANTPFDQVFRNPMEEPTPKPTDSAASAPPPGSVAAILMGNKR